VHTAVDDILEELAGISFSEDAAAEQTPPPEEKKAAFLSASGSTRTPSVTDTLTEVFAIIAESEEDAPPAEPAPEETPPPVKEKHRHTRRMEKQEKAAPPEPEQEESPEQALTPPEPPEEAAFSGVVPMPSEEAETALSGREEHLARERGRTTRRFASKPSEPAPRQERLQGGASLKKMTRRASSAEVRMAEEKAATVRIPPESLPETAWEQADLRSEDTLPPSEPQQEETLSQTRLVTRSLQIDVDEVRADEPDPVEIPADTAGQTEETTRPLQAVPDVPPPEPVLEQVEQTESEPEPELSKAELKKLKKEQQKALEKQRRKERQRAAEKAETAEQAPPPENTGETASGFAPCFKKLAWVNSAAEISSWRKALRDVAGPSMGLGLLIGFFAVIVLALTMLMELTDLVDGALLLWLCVGIGLIAGVAGWGVLSSGLRSLVRFRENRDVMPAALYLMTMLQTVLLALHPDEILLPQVHAYLSVGLFTLACSYFSRWVTASTALRNLRFLHSGGSKYYLHMIRDGRLATEMTRGVVEGPAFVAVNRRTESVSDFMKLSLSADESDRLSRNLAGIGLMAALLSFGFSLLFTWDIPLALTLMTGVCCLFSPVLALFMLCYPMRRVSRFMERAGGVVVSEKALTRYSLVNGAVLDAADIFPKDFVTLCGMKTFGDARVDEVIIQAASMVVGSGSILTGIFEGIVGRDRELLRPVEDRTFEDGRGLIGFIGGQQVFLGNQALLESRGIRLSLDEHRKWTSGVGCACVYLAVAGELCAVFLIRLQTSVRSEEAVQIFADNGISLSVRTVDSFLTPRLLGRLFRVNADRIKILPHRLSPYVDRLCGKVRIKQAVAVNDGTISGFAGCAASARRLAFMESLNRVLVILSIILGMGMLLLLTVLGSLSSVTPLMLLGYACFWPVFGWILQKLIRI
jgi:hypothetical protein